MGWDLVLGFLILAVSVWAVLVAVRANFHAKTASDAAREANRLAGQAVQRAAEANELADRSIRVSKLPHVEPLYRELIAMRPRLRNPDLETVRRLAEDVGPRLLLLSQDMLYPPFIRVRKLVTRIWNDSNRKLDMKAQAENDRFRRQLEEAMAETEKAFREFINR